MQRTLVIIKPDALQRGLAGEIVAENDLYIHWTPNDETDLSHYSVYRGAEPGFVPGPGNRIATPDNASFTDEGYAFSGEYHYKVSAIDIHGNESDYALLGPVDVTGTDLRPTALVDFLAQNRPNPFNPVTTIVFGLDEASHASLEIYDATGRLVRLLVDDQLGANRYERTWDGKDNAGRPVASGVYFYKLVTKDFTQTKKMVLLK